MDKLISGLVQEMIRADIVCEQKKEKIYYGLDLFLFSMISLASLIFLGIIMGKGISTMVLLATFIPLQSFGGGYHCKTHFRCWLLMVSMLLFSLLVLVKLPILSLCMLGIINGYPILFLTPVQHAKAPFSDEFAVRMQWIVRIVYMAYILIVVLGVLTGQNPAAILSGIILSGISIICAYCCQLE